MGSDDRQVQMVLEAHFLPPLGSLAESWLILLTEQAFGWPQ